LHRHQLERLLHLEVVRMVQHSHQLLICWMWQVTLASLQISLSTSSISCINIIINKQNILWRREKSSSGYSDIVDIFEILLPPPPPISSTLSPIAPTTTS
jgi:hypothetical protein